MIPTVIEKLAEYAHNAWAGWMKYMFSKGKLNDAGEIVLPRWTVERWTRQMNTPYHELPQVEQDSDISEANQMLRIFEEYNPTLENAIRELTDTLNRLALLKSI